jgi:hypothetical protein
MRVSRAGRRNQKRLRAHKMLPFSLRMLLATTAAAAVPLLASAQGYNPEWGPSPCPNGRCIPKWKPTYNMSRSTIFMPCNYSGHYDPAVAAKFGIVDFE